MTEPKKKTLLDYFSQENKSNADTDSSLPDENSAKRSKLAKSRTLIASSSYNSIEEIENTSIFHSSEENKEIGKSENIEEKDEALDCSIEDKLNYGSKNDIKCTLKNNSDGNMNVEIRDDIKEEVKPRVSSDGVKDIRSEYKLKKMDDNKVSSIIADFLSIEAASEFENADPASEIGQEAQRYEFLVDVRDKNKRRIEDQNYDPTTLYIPAKYYEKFTPFEKQFWDIKSNHFDTVIFFKKGKFYELYENDADIASKLFDLRVTGRVNMRMAGFPESTYESWAAKFLSHGYKIGKVDQSENSIGKKIREQNTKKDKIITRELTEIVTQGTIYNSDCLGAAFSIYLAVLVQNDECLQDKSSVDSCKHPHHFSVLLYDASINRILTRSFCDSLDLATFKTLFIQNNIKEVITDVKISFPAGIILNQPIKAEIASKRKFDFSNDREFLCFNYLYNYMKTLCRHKALDSAGLSELQDDKEFMDLDGSTIQNLDILENNFDHSDENSLFKAINYCTTPFGQRLLKKWLLAPLVNSEKILFRRKCSEIYSSEDVEMFIPLFRDLKDIERLYGRLNNSNPTFKDLTAFFSTLEKSKILIENLFNFLNGIENPGQDSCLNAQIALTKEHRDSVTRLLESFSLAYTFKDNEIVPGNENDELFILNKALDAIHLRLEKYLEDLKKTTRIQNMCYKSIGKDVYQIEVPSEGNMPSSFYTISATKNVKRYYSKELKELINELVECEEKVFQSQNSILRRAVDSLKAYSVYVSNIILYLASIDCFISFSKFNNAHCTSAPVFSDKLEIINFGNPIYKNFVKNNFNPVEKVTLITGPNMGGKSTFLRSICINIILAQMGMGVPCEYISMPIFDKVFTRIGASDSLAKGESTFMIELNETSKILNSCTCKSFVIMDELGRGTSTRDGEAIAKAVLDYLKDVGCHTLFSTHYHNLVEEYRDVDKAYVNYKFDNDDIVFLYKISNGVCMDSHGLHAAKLAGLPKNIIKRASEIRESIKMNSIKQNK